MADGKKLLDCLQPAGNTTMPSTTTNSKPSGSVSGSMFYIFHDENGSPVMECCCSENANKPHHPKIVLQEVSCCLMPPDDIKTKVKGFMEHNCWCTNSNKIHIF